MQKNKLLYRGKVKSLFETNDPHCLIAEFHDDMTAFDGEKREQLARKGALNNAISCFIMRKLADNGIPTHFIETLSPTETLVKRLAMIPLESVIRNVTAGSLCRRLGIEPKLKLKTPLHELFLKNDALHDPMVCENHALTFNWASRSQLDQMRDYTFQINAILKSLFEEANLILVDSKYEFGVDHAGIICLGDEISPDSCRIWDKTTQNPLDKDRFRKNMGNVMESYEEIAKRLGVEIEGG